MGLRVQLAPKIDQGVEDGQERDIHGPAFHHVEGDRSIQETNAGAAHSGTSSVKRPGPQYMVRTVEQNRVLQ